MLTCTRCKRTRPEVTKSGYVLIRVKKIKNRHTGKTKTVPRCTARSTCSSIARRRNAN